MRISPRKCVIVLIALCWLIGMFLPRVLIEGMFFDGLIYSSIARNLAEGQGSVWHLVFSERVAPLGYFIPNNFTDHPPLVFLTQSWFFRLFGDAWWVEKLYCSIILLCTGGAVVAVWRELYRDDAESQHAWWFALVLWYACPTVLWGYPYNQLDAPMALCDLCAVYCALRALRKEYQNSTLYHIVWSMLAGISVLCAFMAKGPVGLYPLAVPLVLWFAYRSTVQFSRAGFHTVLMLCVLALGGFVLYSHEPARHFMTQYLHNQIGGALSGTRVQELGTSRFDFLRILAIELSPMLLIAGFGACIAWWAHTRKQIQFPLRTSLHYTLIIALSVLAVGASFPIMISLKQSAHYLVPALPLYAMAVASVCLPFVNRWWQSLAGKDLRRSRGVLILILLVVLAYSSTRFGVPARQGEIIRDLRVLTTLIPPKTVLYAPEDIANNHEIAAYFQRYGHYTIVIGTPTEGTFLLEQKTPLCDSLKIYGIPVVLQGLERFAIVPKAQ